MNSYKNQEDLKCCANCGFSFQRMGLTVHCMNKNEWIKETCVEHTGICNSFKFEIDKDNGGEKK